MKKKTTKITNIFVAIAIVVGLILILLKLSFSSIFLYFIPATILVNFIRLWEKII